MTLAHTNNFFFRYANGSKIADDRQILFGADSGVITSRASYLSLFSMEGLCATVTGKEGILDVCVLVPSFAESEYKRICWKEIPVRYVICYLI